MSPKFSLQNVLDFRHRRVERLEVELGRLLTAQRETETRLLSLREFQHDLMERLKDAQQGEIDLSQIGLLRLNIMQVNAYMEDVSFELARVNREVAEKRDELIKARQSEETLQILKKKRHEAYQAEQVQIEARALDDIYIARAFRNQQQGA